ncbi:hypothetical protein JVT61DRAFT_15255 [Boletus reticuloceps]|uniref:NmrA-like domain-containing protein n=1 Tax=Boletus reticuloceps TaxID=495285 RepID=A0A8I3ACL8_9AGAM|nr:hypothetical protein JVT61DRAFT_15255 [Boletus reticuloceps]
MTARIVTVFGATGTQGTAIVVPILGSRVSPFPIGSSVVKALLADGTFTPRAVTRDANSEKALKLKQLGVEVVQGDVWDVASLKNAMNGAEAVFGVTAFWDPTNFPQGPTSEVVMGKNLVDAAIAANVKFFIWSSLPHCTRVSNGKYRQVYHFDNKADVEEYLQDSQLPHANLHTGASISIPFERTFEYLCRMSDSSSYELTIPKYDPDSPQYFSWIERDLGQCVLALLKHYKNDSPQILGETFYAVSDKMTYTDYVNEIEKVVGKPVRFVTGAATGMEVSEVYPLCYEFQSKFGLYPHATIPDPRLERLGVKFHSNKEFAEEELKKRYA